MDDYKFEQRRKKRGSHCIFAYVDPNTGVEKSCLCGCGWRGEPSKKYKVRIVKRTIKENDRRFKFGMG